MVKDSLSRLAQLRARWRRRRYNPDACLSTAEVIAMTDRINALVRHEQTLRERARAERRVNAQGHHR